MAYTEEFSSGSIFPLTTAVAGSIDLTTAAVNGEFALLRHARVKKLMFLVTTAVVGTSNGATVTFTRRITPGSDTGAVVLGTLIIPAGTAIGKVMYKDITPTNMSVGDTIKCAVTTAAAGGSPAGTGYYAFEVYMDAETSLNEADMIASA